MVRTSRKNSHGNPKRRREGAYERLLKQMELTNDQIMTTAKRFKDIEDKTIITEKEVNKYRSDLKKMKTNLESKIKVDYDVKSSVYRSGKSA